MDSSPPAPAPPADSVRRGVVRWGILGTGTVAREFASGLRTVPGARLAAIGSRSADKAARFAAEFGAPAHHGDYAALTRDPGVDAVYVATPHSRHRDDCLLAIAAGKAVLCEKPFAVDAAAAAEIVAAARQRGVFCMEAMWMRFVPAFREARERIRRGEIGEVRMLQADFGVPTPYDPASRFYDPALGGGALLDRGVYPLSLAFALLGAPASVQSTVRMTPSGVDEHVAMLLRYPQGQIATLSATLSGYAANQAVVVGTRGRLTIHEPLCRPDRITLRGAPALDAGESGPPSLAQRLKGALRNSSALRRLKDLMSAGAGSRRIPYAGNGYGHEAEEVGACLAAGRTESEVMPLDESLAIMQTLDAIRSGWQRA